MTLGVVIGSKVGIFIIADILMSQDKKGFFPAIEFPNSPTANVNSPRKIVGLAQKILTLAPGILLCYAGPDNLIQNLVDVLKCEYRKTQSAEATGNLMKLYLNNNRGKFFVGGLQACLVYPQGELEADIVQAGCVLARTEFLGDLWILGSGAGDFCHYVDTQPPHDYPSSINMPTVPNSADRMGYVLDYVVQMLKRQELFGHGVADAFGGGFEIALSKNGYLEKIDNIFFASYEYYVDPQGQIIIQQVGQPIFQFYVGEEFFIVTQPAEGLARSFHVPPLTTSLDISEVMPDLEERRAELVFITLHHRPTQTRDYHIKYQDAGFEEFGLRHVSGTGSYTISFDKQFIARAIKRLIPKS